MDQRVTTPRYKAGDRVQLDHDVGEIKKVRRGSAATSNREPMYYVQHEKGAGWVTEAEIRRNATAE